MRRLRRNEQTVKEDSMAKQKNVRSYGIRKIKRPMAYCMLATVFVITSVFLSISSLNEGRSTINILGSALVLLLAFAEFAVHLRFASAEVMESPRKMMMISISLLVVELLALLMLRVDAGFSPMLIAVMLLSLMVDEHAALASIFICTISTGVISSITAEADYVPLAGMCATLVSGIAAVYSLRMRRTRSTTIIASAIAGAVALLAFAGVMLMHSVDFADYWRSLLWTAGSAVLCGIVTVGIMPLFETLFDVATDARLNELLNNDNPLIKRLMLEAPGTYHHSVLVASLAEAAAEKIGANALLCKVGAYYHDVGKLRSPLYFRENQKPDYNIHDELDPFESAQRIIAHQRDGVTLLTKHRLPGDVIRIVGEHHGDSVMVYFYDKAKRMAPNGAQVDEKQFRYPSKKPSSKESAIVMLADCCEAAVRSMQNPTMKDIQAKVHDVIAHKWNKSDAMLWHSPLTFAEIREIEGSFIKTFAALHHERVEYPDLEDIDVR